MKIEQNVSLHDKNWFQVGGEARYFAQPVTAEEFSQALQYARDNNLPVCVLGEGANILISDNGFDGLVIKPAIKHMIIGEDEFVTAGAGVSMQELIDACLDKNLVGLEEFSAIPGSVGGSVYINIHYFRSFLSDFFVSGSVVNKETGEIQTVDKAWFNFGYDTSTLHDKKHFLVAATFRLKRVDDLKTAYAKGCRDQIIRHRLSRYPNERTCGCFFRNFHEDEVPFEINGRKILAAAYYLDKIGVKGELSIGKAKVSHQHANMIVTSPGATAQDVIGLSEKMQELVFEKFGITLKPECQFIGFE